MGKSLLFTSADKITRLDHEIELFDNSTGNLVVWVCLPNLNSSQNTIIYLYYDNDFIEIKESLITSVWKNPNFNYIFHLKEDNYQNLINSRTLEKNCELTIGTPLFLDEGKIGKAIRFFGNDSLVITNNDNLDLKNNFSFSLWLKMDNVLQDQFFLTKGNCYSECVNFMVGNGNGKIHPSLNGFFASVGSDSSDDGSANYVLCNDIFAENSKWHYIVVTYDSKIFTLWDNGKIKIKAYCDVSPFNSESSLTIGARESGLLNFQGTIGVIDEVILYNSKLTDEWIITSYNNQNDPSLFYILDAEEKRLN